MTVEFIGLKIFFEEAVKAGEVWVARGAHRNIYAQEIENYAYSLPAWSNRERIDEYLRITRLMERFSPHSIPLGTFTSAWLSDQSKGISEVQINPSGNASRVLAVTNQEFQEEVAPS